MPQLDIFSYPTQIFWLVIAVVTIFALIGGFYFPDILLIAKVREALYRSWDVDNLPPSIKKALLLHLSNALKVFFTPISTTKNSLFKPLLDLSLAATLSYAKLRKTSLTNTSNPDAIVPTLKRPLASLIRNKVYSRLLIQKHTIKLRSRYTRKLSPKLLTTKTRLNRLTRITRRKRRFNNLRFKRRFKSRKLIRRFGVLRNKFFKKYLKKRNFQL